ncbi:MAG: DNA recombination protein RmuC [Planctomycetes bacterium]|nr:DNA recombination protein RmuC [Planctomycetota bacterium]
MGIIIAFIVGLIIGAAITLIISVIRSKASKDTFTAISQEVIAQSGKQIISMAEQVLKAQSAAAAAEIEGKKGLIDQSISQMNERVERLRQLVNQIESERQKHYGQLAERLSALSTTTESLRNALAGSKRIGAWGERMTDDVLRVVGMVEGINYVKQSSLAAEGAGRPDYTFFLPNDLTVNMDVKFPLEKALQYLDADDEHKSQAGKEFISAVREHIRTVASARRGYINPAGNTVNYAIVFIPNEQVYSLAMELDHQLMDDALKQRIVLCSPLTLYAMLSVIRSAAENANIAKGAQDVLNLLDAFEKQWQRFKDSMTLMGKKLDEARKEYENLITTRTNMLDKPLAKIAEVRQARGLDIETSQPRQIEQ